MIYLKKGTYYINLNNTSDKETEYNIKVENEELVDIDSINLDSTYIEIEEGVKKAVKYTINPDNATFTSVDWKVSDTSIVSLGYVGNVMNIEALKEGECDITVTAKNGRKDAGTYDVKVTFKGNYTGSLTTKFTIAKANQSLKIKSPKKKMKVGAKAKIKIKANKGHGKVTYKVSNKKIAKIKKGKLVALKKGKVKLTVTLKATKNYKQKKVTITIKIK